MGMSVPAAGDDAGGENREMANSRPVSCETGDQVARERDPIVPVSRSGSLSCSHQQEALWLLHQLDPASPDYNVPFAVRISGELDTEVLHGALTNLVARHEGLRTRFDDVDGLPFQVIDAAPEA
ncbi:MAG: condensation domain-containing protein, partial [Streptosporangiaceae bacterium]